jgi:MFS superfamily sulfate permease-like transporter
VAVEVGLVLACVFFIYRMSTLFSVRAHTADDMPPGVMVFELFGSLFFGAVGKIEALLAQLPAGTRAVVLEMHLLISMDTSGLEALEQLHRVLKRRDIGLVLANVNEQPLSLIRRSGFEPSSVFDAPSPTRARSTRPINFSRLPEHRRLAKLLQRGHATLDGAVALVGQPAQCKHRQ